MYIYIKKHISKQKNVFLKMITKLILPFESLRKEKVHIPYVIKYHNTMTNNFCKIEWRI